MYDNLFDAGARVCAIHPIDLIGDPESPPAWVAVAMGGMLRRLLSEFGSKFGLHEFQTRDQARQQLHGVDCHEMHLTKPLWEVVVIVKIDTTAHVAFLHLQVKSQHASHPRRSNQKLFDITSCDAVKKIDPIFELTARQYSVHLIEQRKVSSRDLGRPSPIRTVAPFNLASQIVEVVKLKIEVVEILDLRMESAIQSAPIRSLLKFDQLSMSSFTRAIRLLHSHDGSGGGRHCRDACNKGLKIVDHVPQRVAGGDVFFNTLFAKKDWSYHADGNRCSERPDHSPCVPTHRRPLSKKLSGEGKSLHTSLAEVH